MRGSRTEISKHFAIDLDTRQFDTVHELRIGHAVNPHRGIDPLNPQSAHFTLADAAIAISILACFIDSLLGDAIDILAAAIIAFVALITLS